MALERFRRQAQVAARIKHPNSVQIIDFGTTPEGVVYIVEELLSGRTLRDIIMQERGLTLSRVVGIFNQICGAVHAAHLNGIVLRNIRPESIFVEVGPDGKELIKVGGYGLAKVDDSMSGGLTWPQRWPRRPSTCRPANSRPAALLALGRYSLGSSLQLRRGRALDRSSERGREDAPAGGDPGVTIRPPGLDEGIAAVVARALAKEPTRRQPTALHLAAELQAVSGAAGGLVGTLFNKATGLLTVRPVIVPQGPAAVPVGEATLPSVVAESESRGRGVNPTVVA